MGTTPPPGVVPILFMAKNINQKRAQVRRAHRNAGSKVSRLTRSNNVNLTGSEFDPRRSGADISKMNSRQLDAYSRKLEKFNSRSYNPTFVGDAQNRPIPVAEWNKFERLKQKASDVIQKRFDAYADIKNPHSGQTAREFRAATTPRHRQAANPTVNLVNAPSDMKPGNVASRAALKKLTTDMYNRTTKRFFTARHIDGRIQLAQMLAEINRPGLGAGVEELTELQFEYLWNETKFAKYISQYYENMQLLKAKGQKAFMQSTNDTAFRGAAKLVSWVKTLELGS